jgi:radical SAM protein with 4Fe4S-binding SPASM domain
MFTALSPENNHNWCGGTGSMLALDYKGNFYPCLRYMETSLGTDQPPLIIGNVWDGIASKQCEKDCLDCLKTITRRSQSTDECFNCPIGAGCAWCSGYNYQVFGTPNKRATYICIMHKARALANVYYWNKWYKKTGQNKLFVNNVPDEWALEIIDQDELNMLKELAQ